MKSKTIDLNQLITRLRNIKGAMPVSFSALVDARATKTGNPFGVIFKLSRVNAFVGFDYENSVNRQLAREGKDQLTFTAKPRKWGVHVNAALVEHKGEYYLSAKPQSTRKPIYLARKGSFLSPIARDLIAPFLPEKRSSAESQGVEKEVVYRDYALRNLVSINIGGESLRIRQPHGTPV